MQYEFSNFLYFKKIELKKKVLILYFKGPFLEQFFDYWL